MLGQERGNARKNLVMDEETGKEKNPLCEPSGRHTSASPLMYHVVGARLVKLVADGYSGCWWWRGFLLGLCELDKVKSGMMCIVLLRKQVERQNKGASFVSSSRVIVEDSIRCKSPFLLMVKPQVPKSKARVFGKAEWVF